MQPFRETLALERRRLENRSREEGPGNARDGTASGAETSFFNTARGEALSQAVLSAPIRLGTAPPAGYHGGRRIRDLVEWSLQASIEAPAPTAPRPRTVRRLSVPSRTSGTLPSHLCPGAVATELRVCAPAM